jgi:hypothetical protein
MYKWTPEEFQYISDHYGLLSNKTIARNLNRSVYGVLWAARKLRLRCLANFYSASELARVLGLADSQGRKVITWVEQGWLKARKGPTGGGRKGKGKLLSRMWTFREVSIVKCLRRRPWLVDMATMPEHYFRSVVKREWQRDPWYTISQLHSLLGSQKTILRYIHRGWLAAEKKPCGGPNGGVFVIRRSAIKAFLADDPRPGSKFKAMREGRRRLFLESNRATKLAMVWLLRCPSCGQEVEVSAPPQLCGPKVREEFIRLYVNGNCEHSSYCLIPIKAPKLATLARSARERRALKGRSDEQVSHETGQQGLP